ncbi:MAG: hypothetical protein H7Z17_02300 [Fuerstia sp.]|nr:hypothetical protein [Fuerstiella sp.]
MRLFLILLILISSAAETLAFQQPVSRRAAEERWHLGSEMFQMLLEEHGLTPEQSWNEALSFPAKSVVVVCGDLQQIHPREWLRARRFVAQGGALLVASEGSFEFPGVCSFFPGAATSSHSPDRYEAFADCIRIRRLKPDDELVKGVSEIVVNRSGWLSTPTDDSLDWQVIASMPGNTQPRGSRNQPIILAGRDAAPQTGVMILVADESLFTNGMLWHGDNAIFAIQVSELLCRKGRRQLLFVRDGVALPSYRESSGMQPPEPKPMTPPAIPPNTELPEPDFETKLQLANAVINEVQESNLINEVLRDRPRQMRPLAYLRTILFILLVLATLFVLWRLMQKRLNLPALPHPRFMQSVFGVMSARQISNSEFGTAIVLLARDLCIELTGSRTETDWIRCLSERPNSPAKNLSRTQRHELADILSLALRGATIHLSRRRFLALGRAIKELRDQHRVSPIIQATT